jgi:glycosyltransferase involved in cell wall biosynthesis
MTAGSRPRLLFLCQNLPYPPDGGALIRSYHTLRLLSRSFDVTALCFFRRASRPSAGDIARAREGLAPLARIETFPIPQEHSRVRYLLDHARSVAGARAYTRWAYESRAVRRRVEAVVADGVDLVHLDSLDLVAYLPLVAGLPVAVAHHNVESQLLERRADAEDGVARAYLRLQAALTRREERRWCARVDLNLTVSPEDAERLREISPGGRYEVVPNGVDTSAFRPAAPGPRQGIVFVGGYGWFPNRDGMEHFARDILPRIRASRPDVPVTWVGRAPEDVRRRLAGHGIVMTGYVEDIRPYVDPAACVVAPLRIGGGTRLKILDAWALGKAVVSTPAGAEGLAVRDGRNILLAEAPDAFADAVLRVLDSEELRGRLEKEGRASAVERYDWDVIGAPMTAAYAALLPMSARVA